MDKKENGRKKREFYIKEKPVTVTGQGLASTLLQLSPLLSSVTVSGREGRVCLCELSGARPASSGLSLLFSSPPLRQLVARADQAFEDQVH